MIQRCAGLPSELVCWDRREYIRVGCNENFLFSMLPTNKF
jgi:hypothetical protein